MFCLGSRSIALKIFLFVIVAIILSNTLCATESTNSLIKARHGTNWNRIGKRFEKYFNTNNVEKFSNPDYQDRMKERLQTILESLISILEAYKRDFYAYGMGLNLLLISCFNF